MSLKEITKDLHDEAEQSQFVKQIFKGNISDEQYSTYLYQLIPVYRAIETGCLVNGDLTDLTGIERASLIESDFLELTVDQSDTYYWFESTKQYLKYLVDLMSDPERRHLIIAHMYCRHMGDLFGGQMLARKTPGSGQMYKFSNPEQLKEKLRAKLDDSLGDEARVAFKWAIEILKDMDNEFRVLE